MKNCCPLRVDNRQAAAVYAAPTTRKSVFKNVMMYRMLSPWTVTAAQLEAALDAARYVECAGSQEKSVGWVEPRGQANAALVEVGKLMA